MKASILGFLQAVALCLFSLTEAWVAIPTTTQMRPFSTTKMRMAEDEDKMAKLVTGEELEIMLTEWEQPLVIDAYATW